MILEIIDTSGKPREVRKYYYGEDAAGSLYATGGTRGLVMIEVNGTQAYVMSDILGSVDSLYRSDTGELIGSYEYDAWGEITDIRQSERFASGGHNPSSTFGTSNQQSLNNDLDYQKLLKTNPIRYSTRYYESEPNLHYYAFRHYAPTLKRWLSRDPIEEVGGHNLYTFCNNDPIGKFDSLGLSFFNDVSPKCYPDGKKDCLIDIFMGHGVADDSPKSIEGTVAKLIKKAVQTAKSKGLTYRDYAIGAVSCYDAYVAPTFGNEYAFPNDERIFDVRRSLLGLGLEIPSYIELEKAEKYARSEMCYDGQVSGKCCRTVTMRINVAVSDHLTAYYYLSYMALNIIKERVYSVNCDVK